MSTYKNQSPVHQSLPLAHPLFVDEYSVFLVHGPQIPGIHPFTFISPSCRSTLARNRDALLKIVALTQFRFSIYIGHNSNRNLSRGYWGVDATLGKCPFEVQRRGCGNNTQRNALKVNWWQGLSRTWRLYAHVDPHQYTRATLLEQGLLCRVHHN